MAGERLTVTIIAKNEVSKIGACLASVTDVADEVVVVDSGSTDGTADLCRRTGARVIVTDWPGFGVQKQRATDAASSDWVLCLDADERLSPELARSILDALQSPKHNAYRFARTNRFMGRYLKHGEGYPDWSLRLFNRKYARWSDDAVHERVIAKGPVGTLVGDLLHDTAETLERYLDKQNRYTSIAAASALSGGRRVSAVQLILSPGLRFVKFYVLRKGFLDGVPGLVHILIGCFNSFVKYAKIREGQSARVPPRA